MREPETAATPHRFGLYLGVLQFFFALSWTVYVIYLPRLAAEAGIDRMWVPWILVADQLIFAACDWAAGTMSDRVASAVGRLGRLATIITGASALAFLLLPLVAPGGGKWPLLVLVAVWAATSSALRVPPLVLLGKYTAAPTHPWLAGLTLFGLGAAGAISPYLTVVLRDEDPRLPFILASVAVMAVTLGLSRMERSVARDRPVTAPIIFSASASRVGPFLLAVALLGLGFQLHTALNAAPAFLKFAKPADLEYLMPVFWIGFNLLMLPATLLTRRYGGPLVMSFGALIGAAAAWAVFRADGLASLTIAQFIAGGAWGCVLMSAITTALALGRPGREGTVIGTMFSVFALMAFVRIAIVAAQYTKSPGVAEALVWAPIVAWLLAGALLLKRPDTSP